MARWLLWAAAAAMAIFGALAFVLPNWASTDFPWKVEPFLAMTIGGWALGTAGVAALAARSSRQDRVLGMNVYLWLFGSLQLLVADDLFLDKLQLGHILTWPYLAGLCRIGRKRCRLAWSTGCASAGPSGTRRSACRSGCRRPRSAWAASPWSWPSGRWSADRAASWLMDEFFPEELSGFSMRAFVAFFASVSGGTLALLAARNARPYLDLDTAGLMLVVPITVAAVVYIDRFDFRASPGGLVYLTAYVVALILFVVIRLVARSDRTCWRPTRSTDVGPRSRGPPPPYSSVKRSSFQGSALLL